MFFDPDTNTYSSFNELESHMEDFMLIIIMLLKSDEGFEQEKNMRWIFLQNPMQIDLVQYKVLHMTF